MDGRMGYGESYCYRSSQSSTWAEVGALSLMDAMLSPAFHGHCVS